MQMTFGKRWALSVFWVITFQALLGRVGFAASTYCPTKH